MALPVRKLFSPSSEDSFRSLYEEHHRLVRRVLFNMTGRQALDDLTQEVFLKAWRGLPKFGAKSSFKTWLYRITVNVAIDHLKRSSLKVVPVELNDLPAPERQDEYRQWQVARAIESLSEDHRSVVVLHYFEELSVERVGQVLEIPAGTVKSRLHHARTKLEAFFEKEGIVL